MLFLNILTLASLALATEKIRLQNWNLRYDSKHDGISVNETISSLNWTVPNDQDVSYYTDYEEETWSKRRIGIANDVIFNKADIFNVNEALKRQVDDLQYLLSEISGVQWEYIGIGRDDGKEKGEYEAIFYNPQIIQVENYTTIWLSETPFEPSKYPGAGSYRSATIGHLKTSSGTKFTLINTHLDDRSDDQRRLGAAMLKQVGAYEYINSEGPVFLTGDFNSQAEGSSSGAYKIATGSLNSSNITLNSTFTDRYSSDISDSFTWGDLYAETEPLKRLGHFSTWDGFKKWGDTSALGGRIDFQFAGKPNSNAKNVPNKYHKALSHKVGETFYDLEFHLSDHRPVISDIEISD